MAKATIRDVARHAGVGVGTVSRVLNGSELVKEETRQRVLAAIAELDYIPNPTARSLSLGKTMSIGVIVPYFTNPSVVERLRGIVSVIKQSAYGLVLFDIETVASRDVLLQNLPMQIDVDGLLIISLSPNDADQKRFARLNIPTILIDTSHPGMSQVTVDNVEGGYKATKHLIQLGHRQIGYISDYLDDPFNNPVRDRFQGYQQALAEAHIPFQPHYHLQGLHGRRSAREMAHKMLSLPRLPTAIFAYSDTQAMGILEAAKERNLRVPEDLSLVGYDDIELAEYLNLTTIQQSLFESGEQGARLLLQALEKPAPPLKKIVLPTNLVVRGTTGPLNQ